MIPRQNEKPSDRLRRIDAAASAWWREFDCYAIGSRIRRDRSDLLLADTARRCELTPAAAVAMLRNRAAA